MADVYVTKTFKITKHGTVSSYQRGCHCDDCTRVGRERKRQLDAERREHPEDAPHGTRGGYCNWGCRCDLCKKAHAEYMKAYRAEQAVPETSEGVAADNLQQQLDELERPYERVLGPDELEGRC